MERLYQGPTTSQLLYRFLLLSELDGADAMARAALSQTLGQLDTTAGIAERLPEEERGWPEVSFLLDVMTEMEPDPSSVAAA